MRTSTERRQNDDQRRGSASLRGYTKRWDRASAAFKRANPLCVGCEAVGEVTLATVTDHIEPHKGDRAKFWDQDNWQPLCAWHHDVVKSRLEAMWTRGEIAIAGLKLESATAKRLTTELV